MNHGHLHARPTRPRTCVCAPTHVSIWPRCRPTSVVNRRRPPYTSWASVDSGPANDSGFTLTFISMADTDGGRASHSKDLGVIGTRWTSEVMRPEKEAMI